MTVNIRLPSLSLPVPGSSSSVPGDKEEEVINNHQIIKVLILSYSSTKQKYLVTPVITETSTTTSATTSLMSQLSTPSSPQIQQQVESVDNNHKDITMYEINPIDIISSTSNHEQRNIKGLVYPILESIMKRSERAVSHIMQKIQIENKKQKQLDDDNDTNATQNVNHGCLPA